MMNTILIIAVLVEGYMLYKFYKEKQSAKKEAETTAINVNALMTENAQLTASLAKANAQMKSSQKKATKAKSAKTEDK